MIIRKEVAVYRVRIKVIRKELYRELAKEYLSDEENVTSCPLLNIGDEFIYEKSAQMPEGFCPWAWIDIYATVSAISNGATYRPWYKNDGTSIICCGDGIRPVIFKIERIKTSTGQAD